MDNTADLALPVGFKILVTGASGYIASHIVQEALTLGYKVRGTVRSTEKGEATKKTFASSDYEYAIVKDMVHEGSFDEAVVGVDAIIHTASIVSFSANPHEVIPGTVAAAVGIMQSATKEPKVKRFVYTSSSAAATLPSPGKKFKLTKDSWDDLAVELAWAPPPYNADRAYPVYAASKTEAERAVWKFVKDHQPKFVVNAVLPNANFGKVISSPGATGGWVKDCLEKKAPYYFPAQWMVNVTDDARIHLAATIDRTLANERILAFDTPFNWNDIIDAINKVKPDAKLEHVPNQGHDLSEPDNALGAELLKKWFGQPGYRGLEQSVRENLEGIA